MSALAVEKQKMMGSLTFIGLAFGGAYAMSRAEVGSAFLIALSLTIGILAFLRIEWAVYLLIISMLLSPEFALGSTVGERAGQGMTLRTDDVLLVIVGISWFLRSALQKELNLLQETPINKPLMYYCLACLVPTLIGLITGQVRMPAGLLFVLKYIEYFFIFWMVINATSSIRQIQRFLFVLYAVALIVSVAAMAQIPSGVRVSAPFEGTHGEPNTLGGYLLFIMSLLLGTALTSARFRKTLLALMGLLFIPFLYTLSRASYLALLPALYTLLYLTHQKKVMLAVSVVVLFVIIFPVVLPQAVVSRIEYTFNPTERVQNRTKVLHQRFDPSTSERLESFKAALDAFQEKPILGWGVTGWGFIDSQYFRTLVETGLVGIAAFFYLIYHLFRMAFSTLAYVRDRDPAFYGLTCGFIAGVVGLLVHASGSNTFIIVRIMEPFWLLCAILFLLPQLLTVKPRMVEPVRSSL